MFIALTQNNQTTFDYLLVGMLAFNALVILVLAFMPGVHARVTDWMLGRKRAR